MTVKISVLTPTIRGLQALAPIEQSLKAQAFDSWEWLIEYGSPDRHDIAAAYNRMLRRARGELVVSAQDYLWFPPEGLEKLWTAWKATGAFLTAPVPKARWITRHRDGSWHPEPPYAAEWRSSCPGWIDWSHWEMDWGAAPLQALKDVGGFDESMDEGQWGNENSNAGYRAMLAGWKFFNVIENPAVGLNHDAIWGHPFRHLYNPERSAARLSDFDNGLKLEL